MYSTYVSSMIFIYFEKKSHSLSFDFFNLELSFTILMLCVDHLLLAGSRVQMGVVSELIPGSRLGNEEEDADWEC